MSKKLLWPATRFVGFFTTAMATVAGAGACIGAGAGAACAGAGTGADCGWAEEGPRWLAPAPLLETETTLAAAVAAFSISCSCSSLCRRCWLLSGQHCPSSTSTEKFFSEDCCALGSLNSSLLGQPMVLSVLCMKMEVTSAAPQCCGSGCASSEHSDGHDDEDEDDAAAPIASVAVVTATDTDTDTAAADWDLRFLRAWNSSARSAVVAADSAAASSAGPGPVARSSSPAVPVPAPAPVPPRVLPRVAPLVTRLRKSAIRDPFRLLAVSLLLIGQTSKQASKQESKFD